MSMIKIPSYIKRFTLYIVSIVRETFPRLRLYFEQHEKMRIYKADDAGHIEAEQRLIATEKPPVKPVVMILLQISKNNVIGSAYL